MKRSDKILFLLTSCIIYIIITTAIFEYGVSDESGIVMKAIWIAVVIVLTGALAFVLRKLMKK